jgi:hypothetical protein
VTTSHAKSVLTSRGPDSFTNVYDLDPFHQMMINFATKIEAKDQYMPSLRVTGMPGKHAPLGTAMESLNDIVGAVYSFLSILLV